MFYYCVWSNFSRAAVPWQRPIVLLHTSLGNSKGIYRIPDILNRCGGGSSWNSPSFLNELVYHERTLCSLPSFGRLDTNVLIRFWNWRKRRAVFSLVSWRQKQRFHCTCRHLEIWRKTKFHLVCIFGNVIKVFSIFVPQTGVEYQNSQEKNFRKLVIRLDYPNYWLLSYMQGTRTR